MGIQSRCLVPLPSFAESLPSISSPSVCPLTIPGDPSSGPTTQVSQRRHKDEENGGSQGESDRHVTRISMLPDNVLLEIFDFCRKDQDCTLQHYGQWKSWKWRFLVHVCHRWRQLVFASPRRLKLQILCTYGTPVRKNLGVWPAFPIVVDYYFQSKTTADDEYNILAALKHVDRVSDIRLALLSSQFEKIATAMQESFPVLTNLHLFFRYGSTPALPAGFLGGSAPCLQKINLVGVPYPALPTLLLSTSGLVELRLLYIPPIAYISPEAMVVSLAALPKLETFVIGFHSATNRPDRIHPPPVTRTVLPSLASFIFQGASEYLEDLVGRIAGPRISDISITYLYQPVHIQVVQLSKFIDLSVGPELAECKHAQVRFSCRGITFNFCRRSNDPDQDKCPATISISYEGVIWEDADISHLRNQFPATLPNVVHLEIETDPEEDQLEGPYIEWSHFFHQFSTVRTLLVYFDFAGLVASALNDLTAEMVTEVFPSLELICLEDNQALSVEKFIVARQHSDCPVTAVNTIEEFRERRESYISK